MAETIPPWALPAVRCAAGGGVTRQRRMGKPLETMGRKATGLRRRGRPRALCSPGRDRKLPETAGRKANWGLKQRILRICRHASPAAG